MYDNLLNLLQPRYEDGSEKKHINKTLCKYLNLLKEQIDTRQDSWDKCKKYTNCYEYIHTVVPNTKQAVCPLKPLSRSFYKMIEMAHMMQLMPRLLNHTTTSAGCGARTFHLAEGPGGFIEAVVYLRKLQQPQQLYQPGVTQAPFADQYIGMTLLDDADTGVPGWKKSRHFLQANPTVFIERGADGRGDLRNPANLAHVFARYRNSMHLITADGGFDFTQQYTDQESVSANLIFCQIAFAMALQAPGGDFVIKFFDTFTKISLDLLFLLANLYDQVSIVKPCTSRPANSEKYVVCCGFRAPSHMEAWVRRLQEILGSLSTPLTGLFAFDLPYYFTSKIEDYNATVGQQQIENILATLNITDHNHLPVHFFAQTLPQQPQPHGHSRLDRLELIKKQHIEKCIAWCQLYQMPYNKILPINNIFLKNSASGHGANGHGATTTSSTMGGRFALLGSSLVTTPP